MPVHFSSLIIGNTYSRPELATLWGYEDFHSISRGVVTPKNTPFIIFFVTKEKQKVLTPYQDLLSEDRLHWEGEQSHGSDRRIIQAGHHGDEIHLFYRERHHSRFLYYGRIVLVEYEIRKSKPNRFIFRVPALPVDNPFKDIENAHDALAALKKTTRETLIQSRLGQGKFRQDVLKLWGGCAVTGIRDARVLKASHVKPWRVADNQERLDAHNGLALIPNLDALFDAGWITFEDSGKIQISALIDIAVLQALGVTHEMRLRAIPEGLPAYLAYHRQFVFITHLAMQ